MMNILEGRPTQSRGVGVGNGQASSSGLAGGMRSSAPPVRSMLDIGDSPAPKHVPSTGQTVGISQQGVRSMLDIGAPEPTRSAPKTPLSPETPHVPASNPHRARLDTSDIRSRERDAVDPRTDYQFSMLPSIQNQALPKRVTQGGKKSIAPIMQGQEYGSAHPGRDGGRHHSTAGNGGGSKSPSSRAFNRSQSPGIGLLPGQGKYITESGKVIVRRRKPLARPTWRRVERCQQAEKSGCRKITIRTKGTGMGWAKAATTKTYRQAAPEMSLGASEVSEGDGEADNVKGQKEKISAPKARSQGRTTRRAW